MLVSFVNTDKAQTCQHKKQLIGAIFKGANIEIFEQGCFSTDLRFSPFRHDIPTDAPRFEYLVDFSMENVGVSQMATKACEQHLQTQHDNGVDRKKISRMYCATSQQKRITL